ncbi:hypothetical protein B0H67DRAFT_567032 [Lasiosphaeris hirsuta]|uniref:Uncharacterized protein n=1 Tax=Lasiosphaeris hirsuta TaxID=260670 RepID=A0AA40E8K5_9PEZI|nr:hypothetical protein B0H67DRAFT_567032 [Lasiosphaeris hirsuta]
MFASIFATFLQGESYHYPIRELYTTCALSCLQHAGDEYKDRSSYPPSAHRLIQPITPPHHPLSVSLTPKPTSHQHQTRPITTNKMHALTLLTLATTALGAAVETRIPRLGAFGVSLTAACPIQNPLILEFAEGNEGPQCRSFYNNTVYTTVNQYYWDPKCLLTLYQTTNCSDDGVVSGPGCWRPDGGIAGYTVTCPYKKS